MQIDLESLSRGAGPLRAQVCIVGGGIAGLVAASALARRGIEVHLLEAGGREPEERSQSLYDAGMAELRHAGTTEGRFRTFGGSSTRWGGQLLPYTDDIFSPPAGSAALAWPISADDLRGFYPEVEDLLGAGHLPFSADLFARFGRKVPEALAASPDILLRASKWAPFARRNLARTLGQETVASRKATVFLHANATELLLSPDGQRVEAVLARGYGSAGLFRFEADEFILAAGTIESSRLLLASRGVAAAGVGNPHDQVGRGFHDHLSYPAAILTGAARATLLDWFAPILDRGTTHTAKLEAGAALRQRLGLLAVMAHVVISEPEDSGAAVVRGLLRAMQKGDSRGAVVESLPRLPGAAVEIARLAFDAKLRRRRAVSAAATVILQVDTEQRARPENRIRLDPAAVDALGLPRAVVHWRISPDELRSIRAYAHFLQAELPRHGVGEIAWQPELGGDAKAPLTGITDTYHPMGGVLMGTDPRCSVVDGDLRVHDVANLSVASCATFPSGGSSNPTFTLMALTLRLTRRLAVGLSSRALSVTA